MAEVSIHAAAEAEYETGMAYYLARSVRAADCFEAAFEQALESIAANPDSYAVCDDRHRAFSMRRYPYALVYRIDGDRIRIVAVAHLRREPGFWTGRS